VRVVLLAGKRGHYYLAARALHREGVLAHFVTSTFFREGGSLQRFFPESRVRQRSDAKLADAPVVSLWPVELLLGRVRGFQYAYNGAFERASLRWLEGDVLHVASTYALRTARVARKRGMRVVVDQQSVHPAAQRRALREAHERLGRRPPPADERKDRKIIAELTQADTILAPSRYVFDENVREGIPAARQRIVPIGVDTTLFTPAPPRTRSEGPLRVLCVGKLSIAKGTPVLLEAARRAGVELTLIGTVAPEMRPYLARHEDHFRHLPPMPHEDLARHYREADVFCLPSWVEGSALVTHEAMASGLPCVVTPNAGAPCEHGKDGWLVEPGDAEALADAFETLDPETRAELGAAARATAEACDVANYGKRLIAAYGPRHLTVSRGSSLN
jgi:glycosyltransferase involved in cell wall biosynthesis